MNQTYYDTLADEKSNFGTFVNNTLESKMKKKKLPRPLVSENYM